MKILMALAFSVVTSVVHAQTFDTNSLWIGSLAPHEFTITTPRELVRLGATGCIRGPFDVYDPKNGAVLFSIKKGDTYPAGCMK